MPGIEEIVCLVNAEAEGGSHRRPEDGHAPHEEHGQTRPGGFHGTLPVQSGIFSIVISLDVLEKNRH